MPLARCRPTSWIVREQQYLALQGELQEAQAELVRVNTDLVNTELRAPFDGTVLRIHARVGERPGDEGILEMGAQRTHGSPGGGL